MGIFGGDSSGELRALASSTDREYRDLEGELSASHEQALLEAIAPLRDKADTFDKLADFRDPMLERALMEGLKQRETQERRQSAQAAGLTGGMRPGDLFTILLAQSQGFLSYQSRVFQERKENLTASVELLKSAGMLETEGATARLSSMAQLGASRIENVANLQAAAIEASNQPSVLANILGGALAAFAGTATGGTLIGEGFKHLFGGFFGGEEEQTSA